MTFVRHLERGPVDYGLTSQSLVDLVGHIARHRVVGHGDTVGEAEDALNRAHCPFSGYSLVPPADLARERRNGEFVLAGIRAGARDARRGRLHGQVALHHVVVGAQLEQVEAYAEPLGDKLGDLDVDACRLVALAPAIGLVVLIDGDAQDARLLHRVERAARRRRGPNPEFRQGDALQIPFPDHSFDIVTIGYGLRNLADWKAGLAEMKRVAKPGGRIVILEFGKPANALWRSLYFTHLKCSVPLTGWIFCGNARAYAYILESLRHYPAQLAVAAQLREIKLTGVRVINLLGGAMAINYAEKPG